MGKDQKKNRKTRLDKGGNSTEFIGFSAFASPASTTNTASGNSCGPSPGGIQQHAQWGPVYTGGDSELHNLFSRLVSKRDALTRCKALEELTNYLQDTAKLKRYQVEAVAHFGWLFQHKLVHYVALTNASAGGGGGGGQQQHQVADSSSVRAACVNVWKAAVERVPKATLNLVQDHVELAGILYVLNVDPAAEVRATANEFWSSPLLVLSSSSSSSSVSESSTKSSWPVKEGLWKYARQILSYGRASVMYEGMLSKSSSSSSSSPAASLTEAQLEVLEETFVRVVSTTLQALNLYLSSSVSAVKKHKNTGMEDVDVDTGAEMDDLLTVDDVALWFKTLRSPSFVVRRCTYQLVATVALNHPQALLLAQQLEQGEQPQLEWLTVVVQAVAGEKQASNIPTLLEMILAVATVVESSSTPSFEMWSVLERPLSKLIRKAGYGARVDAWGPILLPLVAKQSACHARHQQPETHTQKTAASTSPLPFIQAITQGRRVALGRRDRQALLTAQVECLSYLLLRTNNNKQNDEQENNQSSTAPDFLSDADAKTLAEIWLEAWDATLHEEASTSRGDGDSLQKLVQVLAKSWIQLESASRTQRDCAFVLQVPQEWFWEALCISADCSVAILTSLLEVVQSLQQQQLPCARLVQPVKTFFTQNLEQYQASSSSIPTREAYQLYHQVFSFMKSPQSALTNVESFVMSDLLRWMILHTSRLSTLQPQSSQWVRHDFELLAQVLVCSQDDGNSNDNNDGRASRILLLWPSLLKELVAAKIELKWLTLGFKVLIYKNAHARTWIPCSVLDDFVVTLGRCEEKNGYSMDDESTSTIDDDADDEDFRTRLDFLRLCLGLLPEDSTLLVSSTVVSQLLQQGCPQIPALIGVSAPARSDPALLTALLEIVGKKPSLLESEELYRILFTSWLQGGRLFYCETILLLGEDSLSSRFLTQASELLKHQLNVLLEQEDGACVASHAKTWSRAAWRLVQISQQAPSAVQKFDLLGLSDPNRWKQHPDLLYFCTVNVFGKMQSSRERLALIKSSSHGTTTELLVAILLNISEASTDASKAARVKSGRDRSSCFIDAIGGRELDGSLVEALICSIVSIVAEALREKSCTTTVQRGVAVLSQLLRALFLPLLAPISMVPDASSIQEGNSVWYITNPNNPGDRERVQVAKVHYDAQTGHYYTIQLEKSGEIQERQTVVSRLRHSAKDSSADGIAVDAMDGMERLQRARLRDLIMKEIIAAYAASRHWSTLVAELINVLCCTVGLGPERGVGTVHYDLVQCIQGKSCHFSEALRSNRADVAADDLWALSLALGYGLNVPSADWVFSQLVFDPFRTFEGILEYYDARKVVGTVSELDESVLAWLTISLPCAQGLCQSSEASNLVIRTLSLLFQLATAHFDAKSHSGFTGGDLVTTRSLSVGCGLLSIPTQSSANVLLMNQLAGEAARALVAEFASNWENELESDTFGLPGPNWQSFSYFDEIMLLCRKSPSVQNLFALEIDSQLCEELSKKLFVESKRHFCVFLLNCRLKIELPLFSGQDHDRETLHRLEDWVEGLEEEEAEEVRDDVAIVGEWLPRHMMSVIEEWGEEVYEERDEATTVGRLLLWLCVLGVVDVVSPNDFRYRPAFVSYLSQSGAANAALNVALLYDEAINESSGKAPPSLLDVQLLLNDETFVTVPKLSSLVLFLTVEVLPSLSRRWWEESCPKTYITDVQRFVQKYVAPEILQRELARIRTTTEKFGDMAVRSSSVSREVTASYIQDDFTLSVRIFLPPDFPLKSAQVDCSKTLGVLPQRWKRWSLQITLMLNNEGGTLQDALLLWKDNVDKEFEGVEPCPVCYSVLHVKTHKLPSLQCKTCHNRFHFDCLTQWFRSSGKSSCVLCQQPWQGTRIH